MEIVAPGRRIWQLVIFTLFDLIDEWDSLRRLKWVLEGGHLVEENAEGPDVGGAVVVFAADDLRRYIELHTLWGAGFRGGVLEDASYTHGTKFGDG